MENRAFFIQYLTNKPVKVQSHIDSHGVQREFPLTDVADLIAAFFPNTPPNELGQYELHLPEGVSRSALDDDYFATVDQNDTTLDPGCLLPALRSHGLNAKQPLIIKSVSEQPTEVQTSFKHCHISFYNDVSKAAEFNGWLSFHQTIPSSNLNGLYIRESYKTIASSIQPGINKAIITGTPGIGKSLFMIYLLWKLVKTGKRVLIIYHPHIIYYDGRGGVFYCPEGSLPSGNELSFWNDDLWCLFDAKDKFPHDLSRLPYPTCTFVLSTSPRREMVNDFKKPPPPQIFYMPLWNEVELNTIASYFPDAINWHERFRILGGIPRYVLEDTRHNPTALLQAACKQCKLKDCIKIVGLDSTITDKAKAVHSLVHITSTHPFTKSSVSYASETALDIIVANKGIDAKQKILELLESSAGNPLTASLCGYIFEPFAIELLEKGGKFTCRQLVSGKKKKLNPASNPTESVLEIPPSIKIVVDRVEIGQAQEQLYIPKTKNYTAIDAWMPGIGAFQMTVGKTHGIKGDVKKDLVLLGEKGEKLYWLVPPLYFKSFTKKSPRSINQYAVKIPYPSVDK
ncbi:hypothetical protein BC833DRAFT_651928 [Globomyces pollinis-pini]|nr:hypothetical protein BC833DRAFT_651928 [Globomyces pollinis-pini]